LARSLQPDSFIEVYCEAALEVCEGRDPKGIYKKARAGLIKNFTGIDDPYEISEKPEISVPTGSKPLDECVDQVIAYLKTRGIL
jgi:adenylylsulfate kinase